MMKLHDVLCLSAIVGLTLMPASAIGQQKSIKDQLVGTWTLVSWEAKTKEGVTRNPVEKGEPKGAITFTPGGGFYFVILGDIPKLASNDRLNTTPEENKAVAHGTFGYYGTYTVNEAEKSFNVAVERSSYGNQVGTNAKRTITSLSPDELKFTTPVTTSGGSNNWVFRRAK